MTDNKKMKTFAIIVFIAMSILLVIFLTTNKSEPIENLPTESKDTEDDISLSITDFFVHKEGAVYNYSHYNDETKQLLEDYKSETIIFNKNNLYQQKSVFSDFSEYDEIIEITNDSAKILGKNSFATRENLLNEDSYESFLEENSTRTMLFAPIELNNTWEDYNKKSVCEITNVDVYMELPFGNVSAIEVLTNFEDGGFRKDYYTKGIGLVKSITSDVNKEDETFVLKSITYDPIIVKDKAYVYDAYSDQSETLEKNEFLTFNQNYIFELEELLNYTTKTSQVKSLSDNTKIEYVKIARDGDITTISFSQNFLGELNSGGYIEETILSNVAKTVGNYYRTEKVKILINGKEYTDGHISLEEIFTVELE